MRKLSSGLVLVQSHTDDIRFALLECFLSSNFLVSSAYSVYYRKIHTQNGTISYGKGK